ncbi:MAG TPA: LLM class F420-dependent oxidoreductase [Acidimicrobiia bacterium]|nr:LLM class F420-dependent oxidoreductase [Acidimicrobiia bacterium]
MSKVHHGVMVNQLHRRVRIAAQLHPQHGDFAQLRRAAVAAEEAGYDIVYNWDHFFPLYGPSEGFHFECWTVLAALAEATERVELGPLVACNSYRNPHLVADMARTIDHISAGRFILGLGSGWFRRDYEEYGYTFGTKAGRLRALAANLPEVERRLSLLNPPPVRRLPLLIAGTGPQFTLPMVARHADSWHARFPDRPQELEPVVDRLRAICAEVGRDPTSIEWGLGVEPDDLDRFLADDARRYVAMGFTQFTLGFNGPDWRVESGANWLAWRDEMNESHAP